MDFDCRRYAQPVPQKNTTGGALTSYICVSIVAPDDSFYHPLQSNRSKSMANIPNELEKIESGVDHVLGDEFEQWTSSDISAAKYLFSINDLDRFPNLAALAVRR